VAPPPNELQFGERDGSAMPNLVLPSVHDAAPEVRADLVFTQRTNGRRRPHEDILHEIFCRLTFRDEQGRQSKEGQPMRLVGLLQSFASLLPASIRFHLPTTTREWPESLH